MAAGIKVYHGFRGYAEAAKQYGVVAFTLDVETEKSTTLDIGCLNAEQKRYCKALQEAVDHAFAVRDAPDEATAQKIVQDNQHKVQVCFGPPGTGKTAATFLVVDEVLQRGGYVLFAVYTAQLASRVRERFARHPQLHQLRIDTCHAAFGLDDEFIAMPLLSQYQLIVVDEVSQLSGEQNDRVLKLRNYADDVPAMAEMGDRWQMAGFGTSRPWDTLLWRKAVYVTKLVQPYRCQDPEFQKILDMLRTAKPSAETWRYFQRSFLRRQKAWPTKKPTVADIRRLLLAHPDTTMLAVSREGADELKNLAAGKCPQTCPTGAHRRRHRKQS